MNQRELRAIFAPDFRHLVPYQTQLAAALAEQKVDVEFTAGMRRLLPMYRAIKGKPPDVFHLHFPVVYTMRNAAAQKLQLLDQARKCRFFADVWLTSRVAPLVYTVHDLYPTSHEQDALGKAGMHYLLRRSAALIIHSDAAREQVLALGGVSPGKCHVIPHGDLSASMGPPVPRDAARAAMGLGTEKVALALGILAPNKGLEELIAYWKRAQPKTTLLIAGHAPDGGFAQHLNVLASGVPNLRLRFGFLSDYEVKLLFCATDCAVLNYRTIFTSGVASLARSFGVPLLLPARLKTVYLNEPQPSVVRFETLDGDFAAKLEETLSRQPDYEAAEEWRKSIAWDTIAAQTRAVYESTLKAS